MSMQIQSNGCNTASILIFSFAVPFDVPRMYNFIAGRSVHPQSFQLNCISVERH